MKSPAATLALSFCVLACLGLSACNVTGNAPADAPRKAEDIDINGVTNKVRDELTAVGIRYTGEFNGEDRAFVPCDGKLLATLESTKNQLLSLQEKLKTTGRHNEADKIGREYLESLVPIQLELSRYCQSDAAKIQSCLPADGKVYILLDTRVSGSSVQPVVAPFDITDLSAGWPKYNYGIHRVNQYSDGSVQVSFSEIGNGSISSSRLEREGRDFYNSKLDVLKHSAECLRTQELQTPTGKTVQRFMEAAAVSPY